MYCFTHYEGSAKVLVASQDFDCAHCKTEGGIQKGEKFYWIDGFRTYEKLFYPPFGRGMMSHMGPYVPYPILNKSGGNKIDPLTFKDFIPRKMCSECFDHFHKFSKRGRYLESSKTISSVSFKGRHTKRFYGAIYDYKCLVCQTDIPSGTQYVRFGHYDCYCTECIRKLLPLIGREFSHG
jgi:hypothetical protein